MFNLYVSNLAPAKIKVSQICSVKSVIRNEKPETAPVHITHVKLSSNFKSIFNGAIFASVIDPCSFLLAHSAFSWRREAISLSHQQITFCLHSVGVILGCLPTIGRNWSELRPFPPPHPFIEN
jgi:hypothetical protein